MTGYHIFCPNICRIEETIPRLCGES